MPACITAYPPDGAALVRILDEERSYRVGRSRDCEVRIDHFSVSRFHAEILGHQDSWHLHDTGSKNGVRVGGHVVPEAELADATWFSVGDVHCAFELLDAAAAEAQRALRQTRRDTSRALSARLQPTLGTGALLAQSLDVVLELTGLERGFVLHANGGEPLRVRALRGLERQELAGARFSGSAAAVERALASGQPVACCDTGASPWLGSRPSVRLGGIRALLCVPLAGAGGPIGAIYADSHQPGPPVTDLDLELVGNVALHASGAIEAARIGERLAGLVGALADEASAAPRWDQLREPA